MCGRYIHPDAAAIERQWHIGRNSSGPFATRYNVAPTSMVPILRRVDDIDGLELCMARWSFVPHWWKQAKPPALTINARSEEAQTKPMWRDAFRHGRCRVALPALAWYEWQTREQVDPVTGEVKTYKQPFLLRRADFEPFCFAGLMSRWHANETAEPLLTVAILTRPASASTSAVHERMPVVLPDALVDAWLDAEAQSAHSTTKLIEQAQSDFLHYPVRTLVNNARNEGPELAVAADQAGHASRI